MEHLRELDDVAYVRFASVYRNFREPKDFEDALAELSRRRGMRKSRRRRCASERRPADDCDQRFMQLALALGRRGLGSTWPNPAVGAVVVKDGVVIGRGWTQPGGRPHAETEALRRAGEAARGRDALRHARALLASRQDAALRRRHHRGRHRARGLGDRGSQSGSGRARACAAARGRDRGRRRACAPTRRGATMPAISAAFATAGRM